MTYAESEAALGIYMVGNSLLSLFGLCYCCIDARVVTNTYPGL